MEFKNKIYAVQSQWDNGVDVVRVINTGEKPDFEAIGDFAITIVGTIKPQTEWGERNYHITVVDTNGIPVAFLWDCYNIYQYVEAYTGEIASTNN